MSRLLLSVLVLSLFVSPLFTADASKRIIEVNNTTLDLTNLGDQPDDVILKFPQGTVITAKFALSGDLVELTGDNDQLSILINETFYFTMTEDEEFVFSLDGETWKEFEDFVTGSLKVTLSKDEQGNMAIFWAFEANIDR